MVLTEDGEKDFYYAARNSTQPLHIPSPQARGEFPAPERYAAVGSVGKDGGGGMAIPGASSRTAVGGMGGVGSIGAAGGGSMVGSLTGAGGSAALEIPQAGQAMGIGGGDSVEVGSMGSLGGMSWGTPPACDSLDASPTMDGSGLPQGSPPISGMGGMPIAGGGGGGGGGHMGMGMGGFSAGGGGMGSLGRGAGFSSSMTASPPVGGAGLAGMELPAEGDIDDSHDVDETEDMDDGGMMMEDGATGMDL